MHMACAASIAIAFMMAITVVQANECSSGGGCPSDNDPKNAVPLLQTKLQMNVLNDGGEVCSTVGAAGIGHGHACIFPFDYEGASYTSCTTEDYVHHHHKKWCYTEVDSAGNGVLGQWGECASSCEATTTTTTTLTTKAYAATTTTATTLTTKAYSATTTTTTTLTTKEHSECTVLVNHGSYFTVEIEVGTPMEGTSAQKFDVVADTGSDAIIVPSCACVQAGYCSNASRCFSGTNRSSSFSVQNGPHGPPQMGIQFGSGPVQAVIVSETVRVGKLQQVMKDSVLLMTENDLDIQGPFEGILGLGLPGAEARKKELYRQAAARQSSNSSDEDYAQGSGGEIMKELKGHGVDLPSDIANALKAAAAASGAQTWVVNAQDSDSEAHQVPGMSPLAPLQNRKSDKKANAQETKSPANAKDTKRLSLDNSAVQEEHKSANDTGIEVKGFLEEAGIKRFSMCFNDGGNGVLRLGTPKVESALGSVGQLHWGLDFRGISVGNVSAPVSFCDSSKNMSKNQATPCGAIPDSGTTVLMGPAEHILSLYESLCDGWDRCHKNFTAMSLAAENAHNAAVEAYNVDPFGILEAASQASKAVIFQTLIEDCKSWLTPHQGLDELPPIHFHVGGSNGSKQALQLEPWSYILETEEKEFMSNSTDTHKVCRPAFGAMDYQTEQNGPVWILGLPIFYEYVVGYDMEAKPPAISFSAGLCGSCEGGKEHVEGNAANNASFMSESVATKKGHARQLKKVTGPYRMPNMDFSLPL